MVLMRGEWKASSPYWNVSENCDFSDTLLESIRSRWFPFSPFSMRNGMTHRTCIIGKMRVLGDCLGAGAHMKFFVNPADIGINRRTSYIQQVGDFLVKIATGQHSEHFLFA